MYLVAGMVARNYAGPGVVVSFIIAAVASIFSGKYDTAPLCLSPIVFVLTLHGISPVTARKNIHLN
jgi:hypothetical protein